MVTKKALSLDQLRTLIAVYRAGSFSEASRRLGISQPTVTNHIRSLELHFNQLMFERQPGGVTPTATAHDLVARTGGHLDQIERLVNHSQHGVTSTRRVTIGGTRELMNLRVIPALATMPITLPRLDVTLADSQALVERLESGEIELVVTSVRPRNPDIQLWPLEDEELWLVGPRGHPARGKPFSTINAAPLVALNANLPIIRRYWNTVYDAEPRFDPTMLLPDLQSIRAAVLAGLGISVLPNYLVESDVAAGDLVLLDDIEERPINTVFLAASKPAVANRPYIAKIAEALVREIKALQR